MIEEFVKKTAAKRKSQATSENPSLATANDPETVV